MLIDLNFSPFILDQSIFLNNTTSIIIISYIDELLIYKPNIENIQALKIALSKKIEITNLDEISYYLDIEVTRDRAKKSLCVSQRKFIEELLNKFQKSNLRPIKTSTEQGVRLEKYDQNAKKSRHQALSIANWIFDVFDDVTTPRSLICSWFMRALYE